jgi:thiamine-monophosphate kinase
MAEADLIKTLISRARRYQDGQTLIGPGDDAALIAGIPSGLVISTDSYLEGSHYQRAWLEPEELAQRCLAAALSDLAAMGALPRFYTLALTLAGDEDAEFIDAFGRGLGIMGARYKTDLIGGDLTRGATQGVCITVMGSPTNGRVTSRRGAHAGDGLWVSGNLGGSAAGLALLRQRGRDRSDLSLAFRLPQPRILLGSALARMAIASASIDISDGFLLDLSRLCSASACGARIDRSALPHDPRAGRIASLLNRKAETFVLEGGEDYELLFSVPPAMEEAIGDLSTATSVPLTRIGVITDSGRIEDQAGRPLEPKGWDPFSES